MEDILASIRRILNEDEVAPASPNPDATVAEPHEPPAVMEQPNAGGSGGGDDDGVLMLDEAMLVTPAPPAPPVPVAEPAVALSGEAAAPVDGRPGEAASGLLAPAAAAAAASSVGALLRSISQERGSQVHRGGPTIEDLVREEIRPLLKAWLDNHLPPMVERLVRQEIERVTGRVS